MTTGMYQLNAKDLLKGVISAVIGGAVLASLSVLSSVFGVGFDLFTVDWAEVFRNVINAVVVGAMGGFSGFIGHTFFSDQQGKLFGKIG